MDSGLETTITKVTSTISWREFCWKNKCPVWIPFLESGKVKFIRDGPQGQDQC